MASHREQGSYAITRSTPDNEFTVVRTTTEEINIMTDTGEPVPFMGGKSVVVLEFKRIALI